MIQKPLNLLTMNEITLERCYTQPTNKRYADLVGAFRTATQQSYIYSSDGEKVTTSSYVKPKLMRTVKAVGVSTEINIVQCLDLKWNATLPDIAEQYPKVHKELMKMYRKGWLEKYNQIIVDERNKYVASVDKLYNEMVSIHTELNYKSDLATLAELDDLLYCEAEGFLLKMEEKINKKNNPKNLKLYKALQTLRSEPIIECQSA